MSLKNRWLTPRDQILHAITRIYRHRMTTTSGGNLSIRDTDGSIWITPARVDKGRLRREDIVRVFEDGTVEGLHPPSSELPFHRAIYAARPDFRAIVHAHPVALVAFSICRRVPDTRLLPQAHRVCGAVGFAPYALPGSEALGQSLAAVFSSGFQNVVLENHGVATAGATLAEAFERFETLEFCARTIIRAALLGQARYLEPDQADRPQRPIVESDLPSDLSPTSMEKELRRELAGFVRRAYRQRLMISTQGAFSARLLNEPDSFLITPHRRDRGTLRASDCVLIRDGKAEVGRRPSSSATNHRAIYAAHPKVNAVINAYPVNATAFAVTETTLDTRTIPESYIFLRDVNRIQFGAQYGDGAALAARLSLRQPAALLENDGVLVCGTSILDAFDRLEVLETTAEAMIDSRALGIMTPMSDAVIAELSQSFPSKD
jgi:ribulose-5-phosphate 4-epimerase/fuculose-1-phosphate aldolase